MSQALWGKIAKAEAGQPGCNCPLRPSPPSRWRPTGQTPAARSMPPFQSSSSVRVVRVARGTSFLKLGDEITRASPTQSFAPERYHAVYVHR